MKNKKSKKTTNKSNSKHNKSKRKEERVQDLPYHLRGLPNNRYGGHQNSRFRVFKGSTFGAASEGTKFSQEQLEAYAKKNGFKVSERRNDQN